MLKHRYLGRYTQPSLFLQKTKRIWGSEPSVTCPPPYLESKYSKKLKFTPDTRCDRSYLASIYLSLE